MEHDLEAIGMRLQTFFGRYVETIARRTQFVCRVSTLGGSVFLQALVFACIEHSRATLNQFAQACLDLGVAISPQGLDERIGPESVAFMQAMFHQAMRTFRNQLALPLSILQQFSGIYIVDSSSISLPAAMSDEYPGCGGDGPQASLKIQLVFEFLRANLEQVVLQPGRSPDQKYRDYLKIIPPVSLTLLDLGYFTLDHLKAIAKQAYFLTRYLYPTGLLTPAGVPIHLLQELQAHPGHILDMPLLLGKQAKHHIPCRLIARRLRQEVADRRRQKAKERARRDRRSVSKEYLAMLSWDIFLTNVPDSMLSASQIVVLHRVRWQIELLFKLCKSYCGLRQVAQLRKERILTELYARLIGVVLTHFLMGPMRMPLGAQANREISPVQVRKIFQRFARCLHQALANFDELVRNLALMRQHILRFGFKQKRKKHPNICHALNLAAIIHHLDLNIEQELDLPALLA
jgi:hypothetical protein